LIVVNYMQGLRASMAWEYFSLYSADRHYGIGARHGLRLAPEDILDLLDKYGEKICTYRTGMRLLD